MEKKLQQNEDNKLDIYKLYFEYFFWNTINVIEECSLNFVIIIKNKDNEKII